MGGHPLIAHPAAGSADVVAGGVHRLDDVNFPAVTMGQAAELLQVPAAYLRSLDAAGLLHPQRSEGGHRRYSRVELEMAARIRRLSDEGVNLDAASRIVDLQDALAEARARIAELETRLTERIDPGGRP